MKTTVTLEIEVPDKISGKIVTQQEIVDAVEESLVVGINDAQGLVEDFGNRSVFLNSKIKVLSVKTELPCLVPNDLEQKYNHERNTKTT